MVSEYWFKKKLVLVDAVHQGSFVRNYVNRDSWLCSSCKQKFIKTRVCCGKTVNCPFCGQRLVLRMKA